MICDLCQETVDRLVPSYWGQLLCPVCVRRVVRTMDAEGLWPPEPWYDEDASAQQTLAPTQDVVVEVPANHYL